MTNHTKLLENYYNKFNEDKRLNSRRGQVEFTTNLKYIEKYIPLGAKILDVGAGTGKYSLYLDKLGYDVEAVELVKQNLNVIKKKNPTLKSYLGNALDLSFLKENTYDAILLFGPIYHLKKRSEQLKAIEEAKRLLKPNGLLFISYCMNEYAIIAHGFKDGNILTSIISGKVDENFHILEKGNELYDYVRLEDINFIQEKSNLKRLKLVSSDGASSYIKDTLNKMDQSTFEVFLNYHLKTCERQELLGASTHILDILKK